MIVGDLKITITEVCRVDLETHLSMTRWRRSTKNLRCKRFSSTKTSMAIERFQWAHHCHWCCLRHCVFSNWANVFMTVTSPMIVTSSEGLISSAESSRERPPPSSLDGWRSCSAASRQNRPGTARRPLAERWERLRECWESVSASSSPGKSSSARRPWAWLAASTARARPGATTSRPRPIRRWWLWN